MKSQRPGSSATPDDLSKSLSVIGDAIARGLKTWDRSRFLGDLLKAAIGGEGAEEALAAAVVRYRGLLDDEAEQLLLLAHAIEMLDAERKSYRGDVKGRFVHVDVVTEKLIASAPGEPRAQADS